MDQTAALSVTRAARLRNLRGATALFAALTLAPAAQAQSIIEDIFGAKHPHRARPAPVRAHRDHTRARERARPKTKTKKADAAKNREHPAATSARPQPAAEAPPSPYDPQMQRLAEVLGALSLLRDLCGDGDGADWRGKMTALLDADAPAGSRRQKLTAAFNRGFHGYETTYRVCTGNARIAITRYLDEAGRLSRDISYRYGNP
jgi:uncharacterized protein (TIGR02301 family)